MNKRQALRLWKRAFVHLEESEPQVLEWARGINENTFQNLKSKTFLRQYCFVVYASGFRYHTIIAKFPEISCAFEGFDLGKLAAMKRPTKVLRIFNNQRKAQNFLDGAHAIADEGFSAFKKRLAARGSEMLVELPGIGPRTKEHLAKNIGLSDVAKPDVWLHRAADICGARDVFSLVEYLHGRAGESRHVIDVALWKLGRDGLLYDKDGSK